MRLSAGTRSNSRALILLAPFGVDPDSFVDVIGGRQIYDSVLGEMQRFRGRVYVNEGNLEASELSADGRHTQAADPRSWHLLTINEEGSVAACSRILIHSHNVAFRDLVLSHCALAQSECWGYLLRRAVEEQIQSSRQRGMRFAEIGGWAVDRELRCTTEAVRMVMAGYALGQLLGGVAAVSTVNMQHHSSSILRRIGGMPLSAGEVPFPSFYEPQYRAELEILCLNSFQPNPVFQRYIREGLAALRTATVISSVRAIKPIRQDFVPDVYLRTLIRDVYTHEGI